MPRTYSTPPMPLTDVPPHHPAWPILETQGLALEQIKVLAEFIACHEDGDGDMNVLADVILDIVAKAERQRFAALDTLRTHPRRLA